MKKILITTTLLMLASCAGQVTKPGATAAEIEKDKAQCNYEAQKATANGGSGFELAQVYNSCLQQKGFVPVNN